MTVKDGLSLSDGILGFKNFQFKSSKLSFGLAQALLIGKLILIYWRMYGK